MRAISWVKLNREYGSDSNKRRHLKKLLAQERTHKVDDCCSGQIIRSHTIDAASIFILRARARVFCVLSCLGQWFLSLFYCLAFGYVVKFGRLFSLSMRSIPMRREHCFWPNQFNIPHTRTFTQLSVIFVFRIISILRIQTLSSLNRHSYAIDPNVKLRP